MKWEDAVVEKQALRDSRGRIVGGEGSDNRGVADRVEETEGEGFEGGRVDRGCGKAGGCNDEGGASGGGGSSRGVEPGAGGYTGEVDGYPRAGRRERGAGTPPPPDPRLAAKTLEFVERLVALPTKTAQLVALAMIRGEEESDAIARRLRISRWTLWRIRKRLEADKFWRKILR